MGVDTFGVQPSRLLWVPDDFGHDAQLPSLAQAMGFAGVGFWRIPAEQLGFPSGAYPSVPVQACVDKVTYTASAAASSPAVFLVLLARMSTEPARHGMGVWRELRRSGAVALGEATWAVPDLPAVQPLLTRLATLVDAASGVLARAGRPRLRTS